MKMRNRMMIVLLSGTILSGVIMSNANAYYSKTDYTEAFEIGANQSAFLIPMQGANQSSQVQFGSLEYYATNKVPTKRAIIPHAKLAGSGGVNDYYIPAAKLILVDRTPVAREWTDDATTGTANQKQGFHVESKDSINIMVDIVASLSVSEENAAKFLYNFGTVTTENPIKYDPSAQYQSDAYYVASYASISNGRSLAQVADSNVRVVTQAALARAFGDRGLSDAINQKTAIIDAVRKEVTEWCTTRGITVDGFGYGSSLTFEKKVQDSIDNVFIASQESAKLNALSSSADAKERFAKIAVIENSATAILKWNGTIPSLPNLPNLMFIPNNVVDWVSSFFTPATTKQVR